MMMGKRRRRQRGGRFINEYAYDRKSAMGHLDTALDAASAHHWIVIDMKWDWATVLPDRPSIAGSVADRCS